MPSATDNGERPVGVHAAVEELGRASRIPAKQRSAKVSGVVDNICSHAFEHGLDADCLRAVVQIVSRKTELDQTSVTSLIKNLYPAQRVAVDIVVTVVGALGQGKGKPSSGTQHGLVQWLVVVHGIVEDSNLLPRLYNVLFGMLDMISIRTPLCHLLSLLTRRKHVKPFRIQRLLEISRGIGNDPALQGLLRVYKDYYPDIILTTTSTSRKSFPPRPDDDWQTRLFVIKHASSASDEAVTGRDTGFRVLRNSRKEGRGVLLPEVHTFHANENSVTLEEIDNAEDFVASLEKIEPPGQMVSFLADPLLQKFVDLRPSPIAAGRIDLWLAAYLEEEYTTVKSGLKASSDLTKFLENIYKHSQFTKDIHPVVSAFLKSYLQVWDGQTGIDAILGLLSYTRVQPFQDAYDTYFAPAERALASHGVRSLEKLLHFYSELLQHWTSQAPWPVSTLELNNSVQRREVLEDLVAHTSRLCTSLLLSLPNDSAASPSSSILSIYETLSISSRSGTVPIILPPLHMSYLLAQTASTSDLSRLFGVCANYKETFDKLSKPSVSIYPPDITMFNAWIRDLYNFLWGTKALQIVENSPAFFCSSSLRDALNSYLRSIQNDYDIGLAFGLSHNPRLASLSATAWTALEEQEIEKQRLDSSATTLHEGPVTLQSLDVLHKNGGINMGLFEYKKSVLQWLSERGLDGLQKLMYATHTKLRN